MLPSVMQHSFATNPRVEIPRSTFDRSRGIKTTFDAGYIVPFIQPDEIIPGDTIKVDTTLFLRMSTPLHPLMDNVRVETFWFFVPNRLVWDKFQRFMGEQIDPGDSIDFTVPILASGTAIAVGDLAHYFGIPLGLVPNDTDVSCIPFRGHNKIYNDWFRDQDLQDSKEVGLGAGPTAIGEFDVWKRGKRHDYFTSCRPWPLKGGVAVDFPLGTSAPVIPDPAASPASPTFDTSSGVTSTLRYNADAAEFSGSPVGSGGAVWNDPNLVADLENAIAPTLNELRNAIAIQQLLERDARGGTRYIEINFSHFGVVSSDARLQRAEYIGGTSEALTIDPVANTSADGTNAQGELTGIGTALSRGSFVKSFEEHGYVFGYVNVRADLTYQQGLDRMWSKSTRYDFLWPEFAHIGAQAVLNKEIYHQGTSADDQVFGYNNRYDEYRHARSMVTGLFASDAASSLDPWHLSQDFASLPTLGDTFIQDDPPFDRVVAAPSEPHFIMDGYIKWMHTRTLPVHGTPGLARF